MLIGLIFSYSESFFIVFYLSFYFVLGQGPSARDYRHPTQTPHHTLQRVATQRATTGRNTTHNHMTQRHITQPHTPHHNTTHYNTETHKTTQPSMTQQNKTVNNTTQRTGWNQNANLQGGRQRHRAGATRTQWLTTTAPHDDLQEHQHTLFVTALPHGTRRRTVGRPPHDRHCSRATALAYLSSDPGLT